MGILLETEKRFCVWVPLNVSFVGRMLAGCRPHTKIYIELFYGRRSLAINFGFDRFELFFIDGDYRNSIFFFFFCHSFVRLVSFFCYFSVIAVTHMWHVVDRISRAIWRLNGRRRYVDIGTFVLVIVNRTRKKNWKNNICLLCFSFCSDVFAFKFFFLSVPSLFLCWWWTEYKMVDKTFFFF